MAKTNSGVSSHIETCRQSFARYVYIGKASGAAMTRFVYGIYYLHNWAMKSAGVENWRAYAKEPLYWETCRNNDPDFKP